MKLISMTDFISQTKNDFVYSETAKYEDSFKKIVNYAEFLKQPLTLGMFVPCDENGNYWKFPPTNEEWEWAKKDSTEAEQSYKQKEYNYQKAKEKVLFKDSVVIDTEPYKQTKRILIMLKNNPLFRIYNQFDYHDGRVEKQTFPNYENLIIEDVIKYDLELTESALKQIGKPLNKNKDEPFGKSESLNLKKCNTLWKIH